MEIFTRISIGNADVNTCQWIFQPSIFIPMGIHVSGEKYTKFPDWNMKKTKCRYLEIQGE